MAVLIPSVDSGDQRTGNLLSSTNTQALEEAPISFVGTIIPKSASFLEKQLPANECWCPIGSRSVFTI